MASARAPLSPDPWGWIDRVTFSGLYWKIVTLATGLNRSMPDQRALHQAGTIR